MCGLIMFQKYIEKNIFKILKNDINAKKLSFRPLHLYDVISDVTKSRGGSNIFQIFLKGVIQLIFDLKMTLDEYKGQRTRTYQTPIVNHEISFHMEKYKK